MGESGGMRREEGVSVPGKSLCSGGVAAGGGTEVPRTSISGNQQRCRVKSRALVTKGALLLTQVRCLWGYPLQSQTHAAAPSLTAPRAWPGAGV